MLNDSIIIQEILRKKFRIPDFAELAKILTNLKRIPKFFLGSITFPERPAKFREIFTYPWKKS
jgi:hypothetical protein